MAEQQINIRIKLTDEVTANLRKVSGNIEQLGRNIKMTGRNISQIGSIIAMTGGALTAPLILAFKKSAEYSVAVNNEIKRLNNTFTAFTVSISVSLIPAIQKLNNTLQGIFAMWNKLSPQTQQFITQSIFLTGIFLLLGGSITIIVGKIFSLVGGIIQLTGKTMGFIATAVGMKIALVAGIGGALIAVIFLMIKFQSIGRMVMNSLEISIKTLSIGFWTVIQALTKGIAFVIGLIEKAAKLGAMLPNKLGGGWFKDMVKGLDDARTSIDGFADSVEQAKQGLASEVIDVINVDKGQWSGWFEKMKGNITDFFNAFKEGTNQSVGAVYKWGATIEEATRQLAQGMTNTLQTFFFDAFSRQLKSAKEYFAEFGKVIIQILTQVIAKWILVKTVGAMFPSLMPYFHQGGIVKAHSGYLAHDEVPIIAQTGERVLSRRQNAEYERGATGTKSGDTYQPVIVIQAWDAGDIMRNRKSIEAIIANAMRTNSGLRGDIKKYG